MNAALILVAAGKSVRMGTPVPKPFLPLAGRPMMVHSLATLTRIDGLRRVVVVAASDRQRMAKVILDQYGPWPVPISLAEGGAERQDSVAAGLAMVHDEDFVLIHDAARPFIRRDLAEQSLAAAAIAGAAIVALPAHDTVKSSVDGIAIERTLDRSKIWLAQTPQTFRTTLLRQALEHARLTGGLQTDDAALVEAFGSPVRLVPGDPNNRKITTAADLEWAEWYAARPVD